MTEDATGHVLGQDGVQEIRLRRTGPTTFTNAEPITLSAGEAFTTGRHTLVYPAAPGIVALHVFETEDGPS